MSTAKALAAACRRCGKAVEGKSDWCLACGKALRPPTPLTNPDPLDAILPIIQPYEWHGRDHTVSRSLCFMPKLAGTPWLAFYSQRQGRMEYLTPPALAQLNLTAESLERRVIQNIARTPASWTPYTLPSGSQRVPILLYIDEPYACERLFEKPFLIHAQLMYRSKGLAVSVPQRGMLVVTALDFYEPFTAITRTYYDTAQSPRVSPWVFAAENGAITRRFFEDNGEIKLDAVRRSEIN